MLNSLRAENELKRGLEDPSLLSAIAGAMVLHRSPPGGTAVSKVPRISRSVKFHLSLGHGHFDQEWIGLRPWSYPITGTVSP